MAKCNVEPLTAYVGIKVAPSERERLERAAREADRPLSWIVRQALRAYIEGAGQGQRGVVTNGR